MIYLHFIEPKKMVVPVSREALIGREGYDVIVVSDLGRFVIGPDLTVSRPHVRIYLSGSRYAIEDVGSLNGTYVNGKVIEGWARKMKSKSVELRTGDVVEVGVYTVFRVEAIETEIAEESQRKDKCATLLLLSEHAKDTLLILYEVKEGEKDVEELRAKLEFMLSKEVFKNAVGGFSEDLERHLNIIKSDPTMYKSDTQLLEGLRGLLEGIRSQVEAEFKFCTYNSIVR